MAIYLGTAMKCHDSSMVAFLRAWSPGTGLTVWDWRRAGGGESWRRWPATIQGVVFEEERIASWGGCELRI